MTGGRTDRTPPCVSIITVVFNAVRTVRKTVDSVLDLSNPNFEYIVIDGASTDGTSELLEGYRDRIDIFIRERDKGIYDAMNKGVTLANGEWVIFMNAGDSFAGKDVLNFFNTPIDEAVDIIYGDALVRYNTFEKVLPKVSLDQFWKQMPFCHQACFVRTSLLRKRPFDLSYRLSSDYDFFYEAYLKGRRFQYIPVTVCHFDYTEGASLKNAVSSVAERRSIVLKRDPGLAKWWYYTIQVLYVQSGVLAKRVMGKRVSEWLIRLLK
jgi:glycosyltransferase involved in cell wall biosynthesis